MTVEERQRAFQQEYNALVDKYGVDLAPVLVKLNLGQIGEAFQFQLNLRTQEDWQPPQDGKDDTPSSQ